MGDGLLMESIVEQRIVEFAPCIVGIWVDNFLSGIF